MSQPRAWIALKPIWALALAGTLIVIAALAGSFVHHTCGGAAWLALLLAWTLLAFAALRLADRAQHSMAMVIILLCAAIIRLALLPEPPYLSSDIYRYIWDGRVQAAGINPYIYVPAAPELAHLRDTAIYPNINRAGYAPTIYPPVAQMLFWAITRLGNSLLAMKLGLLAFDALTIAALIGLLRTMDLPPARVVAYAWHPLPVWEIAGNGHLDIAMIGLLFSGLWIVACLGRTYLAAAIIAAAAFIKPTALLAMPVLWRPWDWRLPATLVAVGMLVYAPYLSAGKRVFGFLAGYVAEEELSSGGGFRYLAMFERILGPTRGGTAAYLLCAAAILIALALRAGFRTDRSVAESIHALGVLMIAFLMLLTPHYPWYYLALVPFLAMTPWLTPWVLTTAGFLLYNVIDGDNLPSFLARETALHLIALAALAYDIWGKRLQSALSPAHQEVRL